MKPVMQNVMKPVMKKSVIALMCAAAVAATGCGASLPELSDADMDLVGEYAAITLLKYDANSRSRLVELSDEEPDAKEESREHQEPPAESAEEESKEAPQVPVKDNTAAGNVGADSLESFYDFPEGMSIEYRGSEICQSYQGDNASVSVEAGQGQQLLVLNFTLTNGTGQKQEVNLLQGRNQYQVTVNGSYIRTAAPTLLENDLGAYQGSLEDGESRDLILMIEVGGEQKDNVQTISLQLKNASKTYTIQLE